METGFCSKCSKYSYEADVPAKRRAEWTYEEFGTRYVKREILSVKAAIRLEKLAQRERVAYLAELKKVIKIKPKVRN